MYGGLYGCGPVREAGRGGRSNSGESSSSRAGSGAGAGTNWQGSGIATFGGCQSADTCPASDRCWRARASSYYPPFPSLFRILHSSNPVNCNPNTAHSYWTRLTGLASRIPSPLPCACVCVCWEGAHTNPQRALAGMCLGCVKCTRMCACM